MDMRVPVMLAHSLEDTFPGHEDFPAIPGHEHLQLWGVIAFH